jgi:hypothetical protein
MRKFAKSLLAIFVISIIFINVLPANAQSNPKVMVLKSSGIVQTNSAIVERQDISNVVITEIKGEEASASLQIYDKKITGSITANGTAYQVKGNEVENKEDLNIRYFTGKVTNKNDYFFEGYLINDENIIINIYTLSSKGERENPFTIKLDGSKPKIQKKKISDPLLQPAKSKDLSSSLVDSNFDYLGGVFSWGIGIEAQGYRYQANSTPYIARLYTDTDAPRNDSSQPNAITRINILKARINKRASTGSTFQPVNPSSDNVTSFTVRFTVGGVNLTIPVRTSTTQITPDGFGNPHETIHTWTLKSASVYEYGNNNEGILNEHVYWIGNAQKNAYGYYESWIDGRLWYEVVGNYREYFDYGTTLSIWYN